METFWQDLRSAARMLAKSRGFTAIAVLTLALGIGVSTAMFTVAYGVLWHPLPYPQPERIVRLWELDVTGRRSNFAELNFDDLRTRTRSFQALAKYGGDVVSVVGGSEPTRALMQAVSRDFFDVLGVRPAIGRTFFPEEMKEGAPHAAVVSNNYWREYLGGNPDLSAHRLRIYGELYSVAGVMPPGFHYPADADIWVPVELFPENTSRTAHNRHAIGRLRADTSLQKTRIELASIAQALKREFGDSTEMTDVAFVPLLETETGRVHTSLLLLFGASAFLLLVACINVANLLLTKASSRSRELAVRAALGATRRRLVRQFLCESLLLAAGGAVLGVLLASWGTDLLVAMKPGDLPRFSEIHISIAALCFAVAIGACAALALGTTTALHGAPADVQQFLREGRPTQSGSSSHRPRRALVVLQVALTLVLLSGAGLLGRSFLRLLEVNPGFRTHGALAMFLALPESPGPQNVGEKERLVKDLLERLGSLRGVEHAGAVNALPLAGDGANGAFLVVNTPVKDFREFERLMRQPSLAGEAEFRVASKNYFAAMGIPLLRGRLFDERDGPDTTHVAVISASLAQSRWPAEDPIGKQIEFGNMDGDLRLFTIVGIVGDVRELGLDAIPRPTFYGQFRQRPNAARNITIVLEGAAQTARLGAAARDVLRNIAPEIPARFQTLDEIYSASLASRRFALELMGIFAGTVLLLAVLGVYGVASYAAAQRTREFGIRMALGAAPGDVLQLVLWDSFRLALVGIVLGLAGSLAAGRAMTSMLYGVKPADPVTLCGITLLVAGVVLLACSVPARRATRVDPLVALRYE